MLGWGFDHLYLYLIRIIGVKCQSKLTCVGVFD